MLDNNNVDGKEQNSKRKKYEIDEKMKQRLKTFQKNTNISVVDSSEIPNISEKEFLEVEYRQKRWRARETDSLPPHLLSSHGDIFSTACLILVRCMELGEPDVIYIHEDFNNLKEVADDCEVTAEWHTVDGIGQLSLRANGGARISIEQLEKLASAYLRGGNNE